MIENIQYRDELGVVLRALKDKKDGVVGSEDTNVVIVFSGGGARAIASIGQALPLLERGYDPSLLRAIVGNSAGAAVGLYFANGRDVFREGAYFFINKLNRYISFRKPRTIFDVAGLIEAMRSGTAAADINTAAPEPEAFFTGTVDEENRFHLWDVYDKRWDAIEASMLFRTAISRRKGILMDGHWYSDGGVFQAPLAQIAERTDATHILFFANVTEGAAAKPTLAQRYLAVEERIGKAKSSQATRQAIKDSTRLAGIDSLRNRFPHIPVGVVWAPPFLRKLSMFRARPQDLYDIFTACKQDGYAKLNQYNC